MARSILSESGPNGTKSSDLLPQLRGRPISTENKMFGGVNSAPITRVGRHVRISEFRTNDVSEALRRAPRQHQLKDFKMLVLHRIEQTIGIAIRAIGQDLLLSRRQSRISPLRKPSRKSRDVSGL